MEKETEELDENLSATLQVEINPLENKVGVYE